MTSSTTATAAGDGEPPKPGPVVAPGPRGPLWIYGIAFALLLVSGYLQFRGNLDVRLTLVWTSIGLSGAAFVAAVLSVVGPSRRDRPRTVETRKDRAAPAPSTEGTIETTEEPAEPEPEPEPPVTERDADRPSEGAME